MIRSIGLLAVLLSVAAAPPASSSDLRVASLLPFVGDALRTAGAGDVLVAEARRSLHVPAPEGVADLGNPHSPSLEPLAEVRPSLVVADRTLHARLVPDLERSGAEVMLLDTGTVDATLAGLTELGDRVGAGDAMAGEVARVREALSQARLDEPMPVLALFGTPGSFFVLTERSWLGDLLGRTGFELVVPPTGSERMPGLVPLSDEVVSTLRPKLVLLVAHGDPTAVGEAFRRKLASGGPWKGVHEAATRGVEVLSPDLFASNPGLRVAEAADELTRIANGTESASR